jgi:hypothetical protein
MLNMSNSMLNISNISEMSPSNIQEMYKALEEATITAKKASEEAEKIKKKIQEMSHNDVNDNEEEIPDRLFDFLRLKMEKRNGFIGDNKDNKDDKEENIDMIDIDSINSINSINADMNAKIRDFVYSYEDKDETVTLSKLKKNVYFEEKDRDAVVKVAKRYATNLKHMKKIKLRDLDELDIYQMFQMENIKNQRKFIIKGLVQSGKTEYMICLMIYMLLSGKSVVMVVRNIDDDRRQFSKRFNEFRKKYESYFPELNEITLIDNVLKYKKYDQTPKLYVILDNESNVHRMNQILVATMSKYVTIFDEADFVDSGRGIKSKQYDILKMRSSRIFFVSATIMDMLMKEEGISGENLIFLKPSDSKYYKGIVNHKINIVTIPHGNYVHSVTDDVFETNPYFNEFLENYKHQSVFLNHPRICLVNLSHCIEPLFKAQEIISNSHPELAVIVYNSPGLFYRKGDERICGEEVGCHTFSSFLQYLKDKKKSLSHIIILSGYMAGRGISFVSDDYQWHLTDEYLVVSKSADEPELIQKVRLQGIYKDDIPLTLYTTQEARQDLLKAIHRMEELSQACKDVQDKECKTILSEIPITEHKFTKRDMAKNVKIKMNKVKQEIGWSSQIYEGKDFMPDSSLDIYGFSITHNEREEFREDKGYNEEDEKEKDNDDKDNIVETVNKILSGKKTKEAIFMSQLNPNVEYTKDEIIDILKESGYQQPKNMFSSITNPSTKYAHYIMEPTEKGRYKIRDVLQICWKS